MKLSKKKKKVKKFGTSGFVLINKYDTDKSDLEQKISDVDKKKHNVKTDYNAKITEIESKISSTSGLATSAALTAVEIEIHDVSNLVKATASNAKILDIESKYIYHVSL